MKSYPSRSIHAVEVICAEDFIAPGNFLEKLDQILYITVHADFKEPWIYFEVVIRGLEVAASMASEALMANQKSLIGQAHAATNGLTALRLWPLISFRIYVMS